MRKNKLVLCTITLLVLVLLALSPGWDMHTVLAAETTQSTAELVTSQELPKTEIHVPDIEGRLEGLKQRVIDLQVEVKVLTILNVIQLIVICGTLINTARLFKSEKEE